MENGITKQGLIEALKDLNEMLEPDPPLDFECEEELLIQQLTEAAALLEASDRIDAHTDLVLKKYAVEHKASIKSVTETSMAGKKSKPEKVSVKKEKVSVKKEKAKTDEFGFRENSASAFAASLLKEGVTIEEATSQISKKFKKDKRVAEGRIRIIIRAVKSKGFNIIVGDDGAYKVKQ